ELGDQFAHPPEVTGRERVLPLRAERARRSLGGILHWRGCPRSRTPPSPLPCPCRLWPPWPRTAFRSALLLAPGAARPPASWPRAWAAPPPWRPGTAAPAPPRPPAPPPAPRPAPRPA